MNRDHIVYAPLRSVLNVCHWHTAPQITHAAIEHHIPICVRQDLNLQPSKLAQRVRQDFPQENPIRRLRVACSAIEPRTLSASDRIRTCGIRVKSPLPFRLATDALFRFSILTLLFSFHCLLSFPFFFLPDERFELSSPD